MTANGKAPTQQLTGTIIAESDCQIRWIGYESEHYLPYFLALSLCEYFFVFKLKRTDEFSNILFRRNEFLLYLVTNESLGECHTHVLEKGEQTRICNKNK